MNIKIKTKNLVIKLYLISALICFLHFEINAGNFDAKPEQSSNISQNSESANDPLQTGVIKASTEGKVYSPPFYNGSDYSLSTVSTGNFRASATFTSHLSGTVFTAVSEYIPPGTTNPDKIKLFVSYNRGVDWALKSTFEGFDPSVDCRANELDLEVIISGTDTIAFITTGYDYSGHSLSGLLRVNVATGANSFSVWQFGGWNLTSVNNYNPRVTSNNTKYGNTSAVFMTVSHDSAVAAGYKATQRFAAVLIPFTNNTLTYRVANSTNGGFYWGHTTTDRHYIWQDICYFDSAGTDVIYTTYYNKGGFFTYVLPAKSYDYGITSATGFTTSLIQNDTVDQVRLVSCGGVNNQNLLIGIRVKDISLNNYDFRIFVSTNSGINWTNQFAENTTDTSIFTDVQAVKLSSNRYKLAYTTWGKKDYYRGVSYAVGAGFIFTPAYQINNQQADINFFGVKAGYVNSGGGDSCLAVWARDTLLGTSNLYASYLCQVTVGISGNNETPESFLLLQNYPNPFNPTTTIGFDLPKETAVKLSVYDILGREVSLLVDESLNPGSYKINFDASHLPSGVYFYSISAGSYAAAKKMLLIK